MITSRTLHGSVETCKRPPAAVIPFTKNRWNLAYITSIGTRLRIACAQMLPMFC